MLIFENIKRKDNLVSTDIIDVTNNNEKSHIVVDINKRKAVKYSKGEIDGNANKAIYKMIRLCDEYGKKLPSKESYCTH